MTDNIRERTLGERWLPIGMVAGGGVVLVGLSATGSVAALVVGMLGWAVLSVVAGYLVLVRPRWRELRADAGGPASQARQGPRSSRP